MRRESAGGYPGICRVHRAELKMLRGRWPEAEQEARQACDELERFRLLDGIGFAQYEIGEVRLRMGDLDGRPPRHSIGPTSTGTMPSPALALLQLARGEVAEAARSIARALRRDCAGPVAPTGRPAWPTAAGAGRDRARRRATSRRARTRRRGARDDRHATSSARCSRRLRSTARGELLLARGSARRGVAGPRPVVATVAGDGSAL